MDIRGAKKEAKGTTFQNPVTQAKKAAATNPDGYKESTPVNLEKYGGDPVIAQYMEFLETHGITEGDILEALDAIISSGSMTWDFELFGKVPVRFQLRQAWLCDYIMEYMDEAVGHSQNTSMSRYTSLIASSNLAASLVRYGDEEYVINTKEDFQKAVERLGKLSYIVQNTLVNKLAVFDRVVAVATSDWAVKNFTERQQEK